VVKKLLANASPETRADINHLLRYPEDSAGSIMTVEFVDLREQMTVEDAIVRIRRRGLDSETVNICYVVDNQRILKGSVALRYLLLRESDELIGDIMNTKVISINTQTDQEEAALTIQKYGFTAMPVVDNENRMVGIITVDDVVDILQEEATEDIEKMAAILPTDKPYFKMTTFETYKKRMPWLLLLMISATFTGAIITMLAFDIFYGNLKNQIYAYLVVILLDYGLLNYFIYPFESFFYMGEFNSGNTIEDFSQLGFFIPAVLLYFYNGKLGKQNKYSKWIFYIFYPLHLAIIGLIRFLLNYSHM